MTSVWGPAPSYVRSVGSAATWSTRPPTPRLPGPVSEGTLTTPSTKTFGTIALTSGVSFSATGANQQVNSSLDFLQLAPGPSNTYGSLSTSQQSQTVRLSSGDYYFSSITAQGTFTLEIDLSSGQPININVVGDAVFGQDAVLKVKGAGTGGIFTPISQAPNLAALINWTLGGKFDLGGGDNAAWTSIFGGTVYSAFNGSRRRRDHRPASGLVRRAPRLRYDPPGRSLEIQLCARSRTGNYYCCSWPESQQSVLVDASDRAPIACHDCSQHQDGFATGGQAARGTGDLILNNP